MYGIVLFLAVLLPLLTGVAMGVLRTPHSRNILFVEALGVTLACTLAAACTGTGLCGVVDMGLFAFRFGADRVGHLFAVLFAAMFLCAGVFSLEYNLRDKKQGRFNAFFLLTLGAMLGLCYSQNLFTFYCFYECMTLLSMPLVFHEGTGESMKAAVQYLGYSLFGAALVLFGFFYAGRYCDTTNFFEGGSFNAVGLAHRPMALAAAFCLLLGFACKAGMVPLQQWLPVAHPVAPAPASAVLSGCITKAGVLGILRCAYYVFGAELLRGSWVQTVMTVLALVTVFTGSMLAYRERLLKRRLAWSTVSQVSYVLFGLFQFSPAGLAGGVEQAVFHAVSKTALFLCAGAVIHHGGKTQVHQLTGMGKRMPTVFFCFAFASLSLVGIPPFAGFVSKWGLATGGLGTYGTMGVVGAAVLLVSAILTAGYLFPIVIHGCTEDPEESGSLEPGWKMLVPLLVLALSLLALGLFTRPLTGLAESIAAIGEEVVLS